MAKGKKNEPSDRRWWVLAIGLLIFLIVAIIINYNYKSDIISQIEGTVDVDNGDQKIDWSRYVTTDIELKESFHIAKSGIYHFTGALKDGAITINAGAEGEIKLILDNVSITNTAGPAIACYAGDDLVIELVGKSTLEDGSTYSSGLNEDIKSAIYSKADLTFEGDGKLVLTANYSDGIVSKDDLKFSSGTYEITAKDDAIRGKDSVYIISGDYKLKAGADGIKSTNEQKANKGFVLIEDGAFDIDASAKGIKAINNILIYGGTFNIKSYDDAIHSNSYVGIKGGEITIKSGDDGVHADKTLIIEDGKIDITQSYEGLEAQKVTINGGEISIISSDDGINAGGGSDSSAKNRPGAGAFDADENCEIIVNGGEISINASGDGIDSNGAIYINGGTLTVDGPTNNGNGALDAGTEVLIAGGEVVALGSSGMAVAFSSNSSIFNLNIYFNSTYPADTLIVIKDSADETVISQKSAKAFSHATIGSEKLILGETYTIEINSEKYQSFTISEITTTIGNNNRNPMNNGFRR